MLEPREREHDSPPHAPDRPAPAAPKQAPKYPDATRGSKAPPARLNPAQPRIDDDGPPDANALIERLRRQRHQREAEQSAHERASRPQQHAGSDSVIEQRFAAGDGIFCLPYGDGVVRASRIEDGQELLTVTFPAYGDLTIDPAKSLVRKLNNAAPEEDDLL
jgi:hypothetical protein